MGKEKDIKETSVWFALDHGPDNYDDGVRLDQVQAFKAVFIPLPDSEDRDVDVTLQLMGGGEITMHLSEKGYELLKTRLEETAHSA